MREIGYVIQLPKPKPLVEWKKLEVNYDDLDSVIAMVAEDIINREASTTGARAINRFIDNSVKTKVANTIAYRKTNDLSIDGGSRSMTNGKASVEKVSIDVLDV